MKDPLIELEKKIAFQENLLEELNSVIIAQEKRLSELELKYENLKNSVAAGNIMRKAEDEEPPPHY